jgi:8-oxo-dGTP pyrophosphatase MutT (NUDIX family)
MLNDRAVAVIYNKDKRDVLLFWRYRKGREYYIFPGGTAEKGESFETTLVREIFEELNLNVKIHSKLFEYFNDFTHPRTDHFFLITEYSGEVKLGDPEFSSQNRENIFRYEWVSIDKLKEIGLQPSDILDQLKDCLLTV